MVDQGSVFPVASPRGVTAYPCASNQDPHANSHRRHSASPSSTPSLSHHDMTASPSSPTSPIKKWPSRDRSKRMGLAVNPGAKKGVGPPHYGEACWEGRVDMERKSEGRQLSLVLDRLAARLDGASIRRSDVESVLESVEGDATLRSRVNAALVEAQICVIEDVLTKVPARAPVAPVPSAPVRDPIDVARTRLELDRERPRHRLAKRLLTAEEEVGLTLIARPNGTPLEPGGFARLTGEAGLAGEALLLHNMGLIHSVAQRHGGQGLEHDDLVSSGVPGLVRAIELFDPGRGLKFSTYAMQWVRQSISRAVANEGRIIRLPVHVVEAIRHVKATQERLTVDGKMPRWADLADECHISVDKLKELLQLTPAVVSLDQPVGNDGISLGDLVDRPVHEEPVEVNGLGSEDLSSLLAGLSTREADVLRRRHGLDPYDEEQTLEQIGDAHGVTRERIRQIEKKALTKLRIVLRLESPEPRKRRRPPELRGTA